MNKIQYLNLYGSTGNIGTKSLKIVNKYFPSIKINLLVADRNNNKLLKQAILYNPKYVYINDLSKIDKLRKNLVNTNTRVVDTNELFDLWETSESYATGLYNKGFLVFFLTSYKDFSFF